MTTIAKNHHNGTRSNKIFKMVSSRLAKTRNGAFALKRDLSKGKLLYGIDESRKSTRDGTSKGSAGKAKSMQTSYDESERPLSMGDLRKCKTIHAYSDDFKKPNSMGDLRQAKKGNSNLSKKAGKPKKKDGKSKKDQRKNKVSSSSPKQPQKRSNLHPTNNYDLQLVEHPAELLASPITKNGRRMLRRHRVSNTDDSQSIITEVTFSQEFPEPIEDLSGNDDDSTEFASSTADEEGSWTTYFDENDHWDEYLSVIPATLVVRKKISTSSKQ